MILEKPKLFLDCREFLIVLGILSVIVFMRLFLLYLEYSDFTDKPFYYTKATVLQQYTKNRAGKSYEVLKLQSIEGKKFYTTARLLDDLTGKIVRVKMIPDKKVSFRDYLGTFFIKTRVTVIGESPNIEKNRVLDAIALQHQDHRLISFYQAIFLATPLSITLREKIAGLGVSHLVALSGFHLTILWGLVYGLLSLIYKPPQQRWFPYRFMLLDMGIVTLGILGFYLWFVDFPPSLMRSYTMLSIAWVMLILGIELISFELLGFVVMLLLALFPELIVSLGFRFSVIGVFYIYLVLHWSRGSSKLLISLLYIPVGIFVLMLPVVHEVFGITSPWQLLSPLLSLSFIPFYPIVIILHMIGWGGIFDTALLWLFSLPSVYQEHILAQWAVLFYALLSIVSIWSRFFFGLTLIAALLYLCYLFIQ